MSLWIYRFPAHGWTSPATVGLLALAMLGTPAPRAPCEGVQGEPVPRAAMTFQPNQGVVYRNAPRPAPEVTVTSVGDAPLTGELTYEDALVVSFVNLPPGHFVTRTLEPPPGPEGFQLTELRLATDDPFEPLQIGNVEAWHLQRNAFNLTSGSSSISASRGAFEPSIDGDGTRVVFVSNIDFLGEGRTANDFELWLFDANETAGSPFRRLTDVTANNRVERDVNFAAISGDGLTIAFTADADFDGSGVDNGVTELWRHDLTAPPATAITRLTTMGLGRDVFTPAIGADGSRIAFDSDADLLNEGIVDNQFELWLHDANNASAPLTRLTVDPAAGANAQFNLSPSISSDGSLIAFASRADLLDEGRSSLGDIWLCRPDNPPASRLERVTDSAATGPGNRLSLGPVVSGDGSRIAFTSNADLAGAGLDAVFRVWIYDLGAQTFEPIAPTNSLNYGSLAIDETGARVLFQSDANLANETFDTPTELEIWLYDATRPVDERLVRLTDSHRTPGVFEPSYSPRMTSDGASVVFTSSSNLLNRPSPPSGFSHIWLLGPAEAAAGRWSNYR